MANLKDIKNRIQSVESTKKITRAMKMVAAAKVKKSETAVKTSRPYTKELVSMFQKLLNSVTEFSADSLKIKSAIDDYPALLQSRNVKSVGMLVITSNKGLAGAYNANVVRDTLRRIKAYQGLRLSVRRRRCGGCDRRRAGAVLSGLLCSFSAYIHKQRLSVCDRQRRKYGH